MLRLHNGTRNGTPRQRANAHHRHPRTGPHADLADVADLGDERSHEADEAAGRETEDSNEDNDGGARLGGGDPDGEGDDRGQQADGDHDVVAAEFVGGYAGEDTTKDAECREGEC